MNRPTRKKRRTVILYAGPDRNPALIKYRCTVKRALKAVRLLGEVSLVQKAKCGKPIGCYYSELSKFRKDDFPHPVRLAYFTASRAYIVDTVDKLGHPKTVIEYRHDEGRHTDMNDTGALKRMTKGELALFGERHINLYPLQRARMSPTGHKPSGPHNVSLEMHTGLIIPRGARRRFETAGLISREVVDQLDS